MGQRGKKTSELWKYFEPVDKLNAECKLCSKMIKTAGNTTNLKVHLKHQHKAYYSKISGTKLVPQTSQQLEEFLLDEECPQDNVNINTRDKTQEEDGLCKKGKKSKAWNYFEPKDKYSAECKLCNKIIKTAGNTTNIKAHLKHQHNEEYSKIIVTEPLQCKVEQCGEFISDEETSFNTTQEIDVQDKNEIYKIKVSYDAREALITSTAESPSVKRKRIKTNNEDSGSTSSRVNYDRFNFIAKTWAETLRTLPNQQRIIAEKIINDVFYEAQFNSLTRQSHLVLQDNSNMHSVYIPEPSETFENTS